MQKIMVPESDFLRVEALPEAEWTVIVFSHLNYPAGKFAMSRELQDIRASRIFVNCPSNAWYQQGIPDVAPSIDALVTLLLDIVRQLGGKKLVCIGMSMGGYAALLFGLLLKCEHILAFTAELTLGDAYARSFYANNLKVYDYRYRSLQPLIDANNKTQISAIYGTHDQCDLALLWPIAGLIEARNLFKTYLVAGDHQVTYRLKISEILTQLMKMGELKAADISTKYTVSLDISADEILLYSEIRRAFAENAKVSLYPLLKCHPKREVRANLSHWFAIVCFEMKLLDEAEASLKSALELERENFEIFHLMAMVQAGKGHHSEAVKNYQIATKLQPKAHMSFFRAGKSLEALGHNEDAVTCYRHVLAIIPDHSEATARLRMLQGYSPV
ncbi:alpha/beta fold hydrolase [Asticcacaulis taihuensis]|uniref:alpha/beta fold hydrolase n=1 Tax=Asticcacaulis taihuensis TaxID=260084 RepID=UPI0026EF0E44|nr:hypothetical protein [Asticcacaulis taihuensis]